MKKLTVMLLIAAMVLGVSACGNSANKENTATESQMSTQEAEDLQKCCIFCISNFLFNFTGFVRNKVST